MPTSAKTKPCCCTSTRPSPPSAIRRCCFRCMTNKLRLIFPFDLIGINIFDEELLNQAVVSARLPRLKIPEPIASCRRPASRPSPARPSSS
ncbi:MAG: hypothetical protein WKG07_23580 [Hymenobacter sp.]